MGTTRSLTPTFAVAVTLSLLLPPAAGQAPRPFTLHLLPQSTADAFGAKLLDGSPPGYYYRPGSASQKWRIHLRGGGWCWSVADCHSRIGTEGGSSSVWPPSIYSSTNNPNGVMNDEATNPYGDYNTVFVPYGDGTSWTGNREEPLSYQGTNVWFRGKRNLDALLHELNVTGGLLSNATDVIFTGTSAGGLAVYLHAAYVKSRLMPTTGCEAVPNRIYLYVI